MRSSKGAKATSAEAGNFPSERSRAEWLFAFIRTNLDSLSAGQTLDLRKDALGFVGAAAVAIDHGEQWPAAKGDLWDSVYGAAVPAEALSELQAALRSGWERLRAGDWWSLDREIKYGIRRTGSRIVRGRREGRLLDLFLAAAFDVIESWWDELRGCLRCGAVFVRSGKQRYCSSECSRKTRWDRFSAKAGRRRNYRDERTMAMRKRTGAKRLTPGTRKAKKVKPS